MAKINILNENIANIIAAGEVVERPASIVKELIENSIDAKAKRIIVKIDDAGRRLIEVNDDGTGMDLEDARLCLIRHATSKIFTKNDLFSIRSFGFRGEALPSIASVSRLTLETVMDSQGIKIINESGKKISEELFNSSQSGTTVTVRDLFFNTPARYKFMKSDLTELSIITSTIIKTSFCYPMITFELIIDGKQTLNITGNNNLIENIGIAYGFKIAQSMLKIKASNFDFTISGAISAPSIHKSNRNFIHLSINKRPIRNYNIASRIIDAYATLLPPNRFPVVVLDIELDPRLIDVNVHPSKQEVKLSKEKELEQFIYDEVKDVLSLKVFVPENEKPFLNLRESAEEFKEESKDLEFDVMSAINSAFNSQTQMMNENSSILQYENSQHLKGKLIQTTPNLNKVANDENSVQQSFKLFIEPKLGKSLIPIGQIKKTYIIADSQDGYYLIDQHAAMERINYEKYKVLINDITILTTSLLPPIIEIPASDLKIFCSRFQLLEKIGLFLEPFGTNSFRLIEYPIWMKDINIDIFLDQIINMVVNSQQLDLELLQKEAIATIACKASIKANQSLSIMEMEKLLEDLFKCQTPSTCPHGRPTMIFYSYYDIEKSFKRTGF